MPWPRAWCLLLVALSASGADDSFGPLWVAERNPLYTLFITPGFEAARPLVAGQWRLELGSSFSNIFERDGNESYYQEIDLELYTTALSLRRGFGDRWALGCDWSRNSTFAGSLDGFIQNYHDSFGLPNDTRDEVEDGSYTYLLSSIFGVLRNVPEKQQDVAGDVTLTAKYLVLPATAAGMPVSLRLAVKLPVGDAAFSSQKADFALGLLSNKRFGRNILHLGADLVALSPPPELEPIMNRTALVIAASFERRWKRHLSWLLQLDGGTPYFKGTGLATLDEIPLNLTVGLAGNIPRGPDWQFSFAEDVYGDGPSVDFTLDLRLAWRF